VTLLRNVVKLAQYWQGVGCADKPNSPGDKAVLKRLRPGHTPLVVFDVGANRGDYLQLASMQLQGHAVFHAFEPSRAAFSDLEKRFGGKGDIRLNNFALGGKRERLTLYYDTPGSELSSLYPRSIGHHGIEFTGSEQVQVQTLDSYGVEHIDLLKLDVEGHELSVLHGAAQMFKSKAIQMVSFEFGGCNIDSRTFVRDFFEFFAAQQMKFARVTAFGGLHPITRYEEALEQFRTTCFVALR
jgi:FkbM family methyltransferase